MKSQAAPLNRTWAGTGADHRPLSTAANKSNLLPPSLLRIHLSPNGGGSRDGSDLGRNSSSSGLRDSKPELPKILESPPPQC